MTKPAIIPPLLLPVLFFAGVILTGGIVLHSPLCVQGPQISWTDALFTATSAVCVTGLVVVDTGSRFSPIGQAVILALIQAGGLGIMTFTSLAFYLRHHRVSLVDRVAVGQMLLHDPRFHLGRFLTRIVTWTAAIEAVGALLLHLLAPQGFPLFSAVFHAVSAFCNAGFSLYRDSLVRFRADLGVNLVVMGLILLGGIGFSVLNELGEVMAARFRGCLGRNDPGRGPLCTTKNSGRGGEPPAMSCPRLSWYTGLVLRTSGWLIVFGWLGILLADFIGFQRSIPDSEAMLASLFQSVTCRTAGFNTLDIGRMTTVSLAVMILLMFIGGAPGSCAGGVKVTTGRALAGFVMAQLRGRDQVVVTRIAIDKESVDRALILVFLAGTIVFSATLLLTISEGGDIPHPQARGLFLDLLFESVSAFGTVGLSTGITAGLSTFGKWVLIALMFIGRLGPLVFLGAVQGLHREPFFRWPEEPVLIG